MEYTIIDSIEIYSPQDPSVGLMPIHATIDLGQWGQVLDSELRDEFLADVKELFGKWFDDKVILGWSETIKFED